MGHEEVEANKDIITTIEEYNITKDKITPSNDTVHTKKIKYRNNFYMKAITTLWISVLVFEIFEDWIKRNLYS